MLHPGFKLIIAAAWVASAVKIQRRPVVEDDVEVWDEAEVVGGAAPPYHPHKGSRPNSPLEFEPDPDWIKLPSPTYPTAPIKLGILMMADTMINNPGMWLAWFEQAERDDVKFNAAIHARDGIIGWNDSRAQRPFRIFVMRGFAKTAWGYLVQAEYALLGHLLWDREITHFVMVSGDTVPVKPLRWMVNELMQAPDSRFCTADHKIPPRAEMWWLLSRRDAVLFYNHSDMIGGRTRMSADEKVWYIPLTRRLQYWGQEKANIVKECIMFTDWKTNLTTPHTWMEHIDQCNCPSLLQEAQKGAEISHPNTYETLSPESARELARSPFWFARKFAAGAESQESVVAAVAAWENCTAVSARTAGSNLNSAAEEGDRTNTTPSD